MSAYDATATDTAKITDSVPVNISAVCVMSETMSITEALNVYKIISDILAETLSATSATSSVWAGDGVASTTATITDTASIYKSILIVVSDSLSIVDAVTPNATFNLLVEDGINFTAVLVIDGDEYVVWVANADTLAHSQYSGFNFNSMCRIGDHYYGAKDGGIYLLEGDDDAGENIDSLLTLPTTEFGSSKEKRLPKVYMGVSNDGDMHLKIITRGGVERVYAFSKTSQGYSEAGAALGRGIKSRYFTFDVYNVDGGDIVLEKIEFFPVILARLINS